MKIGRKEAKEAAQAKWGEAAGVWSESRYLPRTRYCAAPVKPAGNLTNCTLRDQIEAPSWAELIAALAVEGQAATSSPKPPVAAPVSGVAK